MPNGLAQSMNAAAFPALKDYSILRKLGRGGSATVYLAIQNSLQREVALKILAAGDDEHQLERRFLRESRILAELRHQGLVQVFDARQELGITFLAMEYLPHGSLAERIDDGLPLGEALGIMLHVLSAVHFAHAHGIVHGALDPQKILFRTPSEPVVVGFGIPHDQPYFDMLAQSGIIFGAQDYLSPEQYCGEEADRRSDQYSLGVVFYEILGGQSRRGPVPQLSRGLGDFQPVLDRMMAKSSCDRFETLAHCADAMRNVVASSRSLMQQLRDGAYGS